MKRNLKILTIGNSFTDSLVMFFPDVVKSAGCELLFDRANHGGCELRRHWSYVENEEKDDACRMYQDQKFKLREILAREPWDIVTLQQASHESWDPATYQPYAGLLHDYVKKHAPGAEIVIQQTWSYRADDPRLLPGGAWGFDQDGMYLRLEKAYRKLASELNLRMIPSGYAVQLARKEQPFRFQNYDPGVLKTLHWPDMPSQAGSIVGQMCWQKGEDGELVLGRDTIHLNTRGQYLQACVWFAYLYGRNTSEISYVPRLVADSDARFLRGIAQRAVDEFLQEKHG